MEADCQEIMTRLVSRVAERLYTETAGWGCVLSDAYGQEFLDAGRRNAASKGIAPLASLHTVTSGFISDAVPRKCALEDRSFPFEELSKITEVESWRKEINRPLYHIHKWWARRLGSAFRSMLIGAFAPSGASVVDLFYKPTRIDNNLVVFDPFMGSGTTIGETIKLGAKAVGRDINPVAYFLVKNALASHDRSAVLKTYADIEHDIADKIRQFYRTTLSDGKEADVLYYFWVKTIDCPVCSEEVSLFSSYTFARHVYFKKQPYVQAVCPDCGGINRVRFDASKVSCATCQSTYDPQAGVASRHEATCQSCTHTFSIAKTVRNTGKPPCHRMYAKLVYTEDGNKLYLPASEGDINLYNEASKLLAKLNDAYPVVAISSGYNTDQVIGYNYRYWHEMFNARQLLCLSMLADRIKQIDSPSLRELFTCLFSGTLEFNNMFASYKGEGTGAVRHMFSHHILKPERMPLEANIWGTAKSSGSFSTLFRNRIKRALDYANDPFELFPHALSGGGTNKKVYGLSEKIGFAVADEYSAFAEGQHVYLSCGDSSKTDLPDKSIDAVITDPPFFDNVHYSQLADFFYVWQRHILGCDGYLQADTTRSEGEVQSSDVDDFTERLLAVWTEAHRVLKDGGLLAFTYHHSRAEGWRSVLQALMTSGFVITAAHPIKSEMSVATPKHQAREPIDLDIIIVCRKRSQIASYRQDIDLWSETMALANDQTQRMFASGRKLSRNDVRVIIMAQLLKQVSVFCTVEEAMSWLNVAQGKIEELITELDNRTANKCASGQRAG